MQCGQPVDILVVEDNASDRESIVDSLRESIQGVNVTAVCDGTEALDFLFARGNWTDRADAESPKFVLLDLEMPGMNGLSVLGKIRSLEPENELTLIPVVIFTDSQDSGNIEECYRCGANSYILKPLSYPDFQAVVNAVGNYWMKHNRTSP